MDLVTCGTCAAAVADAFIEQHEAWHRRLASKLAFPEDVTARRMALAADDLAWDIWDSVRGYWP